MSRGVAISCITMVEGILFSMVRFSASSLVTCSFARRALARMGDEVAAKIVAVPVCEREPASLCSDLANALPA